MCGSEWVGYLEHKDGKALGVYTANVGPGNYTVFAEMLKWRGERDFQGLPWCAVFVYAMIGPVLGRASARTGKLVRQCRRKGLLRGRDFTPGAGDLIFIDTQGKGRACHCGIVEAVTETEVISIDGNTVDPSGHFPPGYGGAVARRTRDRDDPRILGYGEIGGLTCPLKSGTTT